MNEKEANQLWDEINKRYLILVEIEYSDDRVLDSLNMANRLTYDKLIKEASKYTTKAYREYRNKEYDNLESYSDKVGDLYLEIHRLWNSN